MSPMAPVYVIDMIGSSLTIVVCFFAFYVIRRTYMAQRGVWLYTYLYAQTIALCIFGVSRSAGHIVKHVLLSFERPEIWKMLAPVSGSINSFTFIIFGLAAAMYSNVKATSDRMDALVEGKRELKLAKESIERSLDEKNVLLREVHHRVKNNMAVITSLLDMQMIVIEDADFKQVLRECKQRVKAMALVHDKLYRTSDFSNISVRDYIEELINDLLLSFGQPHIKTSLNVSDLRLDLDTLIPLGLIVNEITSNSLKHAFGGVEDPGLSVDLHSEDGRIMLEIADNGVGLEEKRDILKKTLGMNIINALTGQIKGTIQMDSTSGLKYSISFPKTGRKII